VFHNPVHPVVDTALGKTIAFVLMLSPCRLLRSSHPTLRLREMASTIFADQADEAKVDLG
jgi:hypothetical protein